MKQDLGIQHTLMITFIAVVLIAVFAFVTDYAGDVLFKIGPEGIHFEIVGDE